jgi:hypothetical protein
MIKAGQVTCVEERRGAYGILVEKPNVKRPLGKCGYCGW